MISAICGQRLESVLRQSICDHPNKISRVLTIFFQVFVAVECCGVKTTPDPVGFFQRTPAIFNHGPYRFVTPIDQYDATPTMSPDRVGKKLPDKTAVHVGSAGRSSGIGCCEWRLNCQTSLSYSACASVLLRAKRSGHPFHQAPLGACESRKVLTSRMKSPRGPSFALRLHTHCQNMGSERNSSSRYG